jgi:mono/diheme cytochrome c family protein
MHRRHTTFALAAILVLTVSLSAACGGAGTPTTGPTQPADGPRDAAQLFAAACAACHGPLGEGGLSGVPLNKTSAADRQLVIRAIRDGVGAMPASSGGMTDEEITALAEHVAGLP